jgi:hypothetical protein
MVILDQMPIRICKKKGFRGLMATLEPSYAVPSRPTLRKNVLDMDDRTTQFVVQNLPYQGEHGCMARGGHGWTP